MLALNLSDRRQPLMNRVYSFPNVPFHLLGHLTQCINPRFRCHRIAVLVLAYNLCWLGQA